MHLDSDTASWVSLGLVRELGPAGFRLLLKNFGLPGNILTASHRQLMRWVAEPVAQSILSPDRQPQIESTLAWLAIQGHSLVTLADASYPHLLLQISDPPPMLFVAGEPRHLSRPALAVVGSRNATPQGLANARAFAKTASASGLTIVSGLALGIDAAAHQGALEASGSTVAVLGCGVDVEYPRSNGPLAREISRRGALVSEFPLGAPPQQANFPRRNRIISALARGCLVVEAALPSGSLITARLAAEQGREVFAIPGSIHSPHARGCHALIKQGAKLVDSVQDILQELNCPAPALPAAAANAEPNLLEPCDILLQYVGYDPCGLDDLVLRSGLTTAEVSAMLLRLELDEKVGPLPGGLYQKLN